MWQHKAFFNPESCPTPPISVLALLMCWMQGLLEAHESVAGHTLADLPSCSSSAAAAELPTLLLIDTAGCNFDEQQEQDGDSRYAWHIVKHRVQQAITAVPTPKQHKNDHH
jgi:hypothetical protein